MSSPSLLATWDASASQPFLPSIAKDAHFTVGFALLFIALILSGLFGLSACPAFTTVSTDNFVLINA